MPKATIIPIADLHCDLLAYLAHVPGRSPYDPSPRCSIPHLRQGHVAFQVLAIFTETTPDSTRLGLAQSRIFDELVRDHGDALFAVRDAADARAALATAGERIGVMAAIENASSFCGEDEPLDTGLTRFEEIAERVGRLLYVSLTWKSENRFGGGNDAAAGLKDDGRRLLEFLSGRRVALDFSHASPRLAAEMIDFVDARGLDLPLCASHSCFAALLDIPRNLPDEIAHEIIARGGVIGLNFLRYFLGDDETSFLKHVEHAIALGGAEHYAMGADFFSVDDLPPHHHAEMPEDVYFPGFDDASSYPRLLELLAREISGAEDLLEDLGHRNVIRFLPP